VIGSRPPGALRTFIVGLLLTASAVGLASCAGEDQRGSAAHRMLEWVNGTTFGEDIGTLIADNERIPKEVPNGTGAVHAGCGALVDDAESANDELPTPDTQVSDWLSTAYGLEGTAGNQCYSAGATNPTLLAKAERNMIRAEALYTEALVRINAIDGHTVSTTTTTENPADGGIFG
jgi:hypothetical protein